MAKAKYIDIHSERIGDVSAQASATGTKMETTRTELIALQKQLNEEQTVLEKRWGYCAEESIPTEALKEQKSRMDEVKNLFAEANRLAGETSDQLEQKTSLLKLAVSAMGGLAQTVYATAVSVISGALSGETEPADDWAYIGTWDTKNYTNSDKNWAPDFKKKNDYSDYQVVEGFKEEYVLFQRNYVHGSVACTATSDAIVGSIMKGEKLTPGDSYWNVYSDGGLSCTWPNTKKLNNTGNLSVTGQCQVIYEYVQQGKPVVLRVPGHSVVAVGVKNGVDVNNITPDDILIIDPGDGKVKTANEIYSGWSSNTTQLKMKQGSWDLRVPRE